MKRDFAFQHYKISGSSLIEKTVAGLKPLDPEMMKKAREQEDNLTKPLGSLGRLEELAVKVCGIQGRIHPSLRKKRVVVFASDHGVVSEGVSAYPQEVTAQMVYNFLRGGAGINAIARTIGAEVRVVDMGVSHDFGRIPGLISLKVRKGTSNFTRGPAMSMPELSRCLEAGVELAHLAKKDGVDMIAGGDMGIGNTTSASALFCAYLGIAAKSVVGPGTGITPSQIRHKAKVVEKALAVNKDSLSDPMRTLAGLGGFEIAGMTGLYLGAAEKHITVLVDGFIATSAALAAMKICPAISGLLIFSHLSEETGHKVILEKMGVSPLLSLNLRLGEGTGACLAMAVVEAALSCHNRMATFKSAGVSEREK